MDLAADLVYLKKLLMSTQIHYQNPHSEAMMLKVLWTYDKNPGRESEMNMSKNLLKEVTELVETPGEPSERALAVIKKGLRMNPRSHQLYSLRGKIYAEKRDWQMAIRWYETARRMLKLDKIRDTEKAADEYNEELRKAYRRRGEWHEKNGRLIEAVADYEQVLILRPSRDQIFQLQDMLLRCLRKLEKYEAYCLAWSEFAKGSRPQRTADLMTKHAEFKIHIREVAAARRMLREALSLDKNNAEARDLMQVILDTGHTMLAYAVIWCIHGCYDKALTTIDKGTDCDPYNPGFTVLKTIVLRLSGRLDEAMQWLDSVNKAFYKLLDPSINTRGSIMGNLTVDQTRAMLIDQWYLIRYDMAIERMTNGRYESALRLLENEKLLGRFVEPRLSMGDCFVRQGKLGLALKSYVEAHEASLSRRCWEGSEKKRLIAQRVTEILNGQSRRDIQTKRTAKAMRNAQGSLDVLRKQKIPLTRLPNERSEALMYLARSHYQASPIRPTSTCLSALADSLSFARGVDDGGIRNYVTGDNAELHKTISCFGSEKKFPYCTKILIQN